MKKQLTFCLVVLFLGCSGGEPPESQPPVSGSGGPPSSEDSLAAEEVADEPEAGFPDDIPGMFDMADSRGSLFGALEGELVEPFESMTVEQFDAAWKIDLDVSNQPAGEVLEELFGKLGLSYEPTDAEEAQLAKSVTVNVPGCSRLQAVEEVCRLVGLYPSYQVPDASDAFMSFEPDDQPESTVTLKSGARPFPVAFAGPILVEVLGVETFPPYATGTLKLGIHTLALPPGVENLLREKGDEAFVLEEVTGAGGQDLWDTDRASMIWSPGQGPHLVPLKNLLRGLASIETVRGEVRVPVPTQVANLQWTKLEPGNSKETDGVQVTLQQVDLKESCSLRFDVTNLDPDEITWQPLDDQGQALELGGTGTFSFNNRAQVEFTVEGRPASLIASVGSGGSARFDQLEAGARRELAGGRIALQSVEYSESCNLSVQAKGVDSDSIRLVPQDAEGKPLKVQDNWGSGFGDEVQINVTVQGRPASVTASCITAMEQVEYEFSLKQVPVGALESMPEKLDTLQFAGHQTPVTIEFVGIVPDEHFPDKKNLRLRAINHSNKDVRQIDMLLVYLDDSGKKLKEWPSSHFGSLHGTQGSVKTVVAGSGTAEFDQTAFFMPEETKSASVTVRSVTFADATVWEPDSAQGRPGEE
jgi:hypothetical protein